MPLPTWTDTQVIGQLDSGSKWTGPTITYAFATSTTGLTSFFGETGAFSAFTAAQQAAATIALSLWDDLIAPDLVLTTSTSSDIEFANSLDASLNDYAAAYFPTGGTVWINNAYNGTGNTGYNTLNNNLVNPVIGRHGFATYIHEIGHAFGLNHPGNYNGTPASPSNYRDSTVYSIMSYFGPSWGTAGAPGDVAWADWVGSDGVLYEPQTMMIDDILAIQSMYGAETTTRTGNTTYGFSSTLSNVQGGIYDFSQNLNPILCLYDSGGVDTLDVSGWSTQSLINLTAGAFSSCNSMTNNISIAYGVQIENASAGGGNDTLTGNNADNILSGGAGADILNGGLGNDTLIGGAGADQLNGEGGSDTASYAGSIAGVTVNLALATAQVSGGDASGDVLTGIANLIGSSNGDTLTGNSAVNVLNGGLGDDTLVGGAGADQLIGGGGVDTASYAGSGAGVTVNLALATAQVSGGDASGDVLTAILNLVGSSNADSLAGNASANILSGGDGDDTIDGKGGADSLFGGNGNDTIYFDSLDNLANVLGGSGTDTLIVNGSVVPTSFDLGLHEFEKAIAIINDTTNQAWNQINNIYDILWRLTQSNIGYDNGSSRETNYDVSNALSYLSQLLDRDSLGRLTFIQTVNDDSSNREVTYDAANAVGYIQQLIDRDTLNRLTYVQTIYDNNSNSESIYDAQNAVGYKVQQVDRDALARVTYVKTTYDNDANSETIYDATNAVGYKTQQVDRDALGRLTYVKTTYDNDANSETIYDATNAVGYKTQQVDRDALGRLTYVKTTYDNDANSETIYDAVNAVAYSTQRVDRDALGRLTYVLTTNDDNSSRETVYDASNISTTRSQFIDRNSLGQLSYIQTINDDNSRREVSYDVADVQPWTTITYDYDSSGNLINFFYT